MAERRQKDDFCGDNAQFTALHLAQCRNVPLPRPHQIPLPGANLGQAMFDRGRLRPSLDNSPQLNTSPPSTTVKAGLGLHSERLASLCRGAVCRYGAPSARSPSIQCTMGRPWDGAPDDCRRCFYSRGRGGGARRGTELGRDSSSPPHWHRQACCAPDEHLLAQEGSMTIQ